MSPPFPALPALPLDRESLAPALGSFRGGFASIDLTPLEPNPLVRAVTLKRWMYTAIVTDTHFVAVALVHLGYAATMFAFVTERGQGIIHSESTLLPAFALQIGPSAGAGCSVTGRWLGRWASLTRAESGTTYALEVRTPDLSLHASLDTNGAPASLTAVVPVVGGKLNVTEKRVLLPTSGELTAKGRRVSLDGAVAGYDYTHGLLARRTRWRWAFLMGRTQTGERIGLNLVEGFNGAPECIVWINDEMHAVDEGRFTFDPTHVMSTWHVRTRDGQVDLSFSPIGLHAEKKNLGLIRSEFVQPSGEFSGTVTVGGTTYELARVLGVVEDQDVTW